MTLRTTAVAVALAVVAVPVISACGSDDPSSAASRQRNPYSPTSKPRDTIMQKAPADYHAVTGPGYTISSPGEFQEQRTKSSNGQPMLILQKPSEVDALPQRVVVIRDVNPKQSAAEQSFALESAKSAAGASAKAKRVEIKAPEGQTAYLLTWQENRPSKGTADVGVTYWQLMWQSSSKLILNVVALAPTEEFKTSEVSKILRTFKVTSS